MPPPARGLAEGVAEGLDRGAAGALAAAGERAGTVVEPAPARGGGVADVATAGGVGEFSPVPGAPGIPQTSQYPSVMVPVHPGC